VTPELWERIESFFAEVADLGKQERSERLEAISRTDPELYEELKSLLEAHDEADALLGGLENLVSQPDFQASPSADAKGGRLDPYSLIGKTLGSYEVTSLLGAGGMGVLYRAVDKQLDRDVALKFLPPQWSANKQFKQRFLREARAAAALDHPNICAIYEVGETEEGQLFIAMAHYAGETLREKVTRGSLRLDEALNLTAQAASGLAAAHSRGIVHRDIKPANLMVTEDGTLKILDFGLAKTAEAGLTESGMRLGTPAYMSPEQTRGEDIDGRSDLWSLGVVLYEMLTGKRPFRGERNSTIIHAIRHDEPESPRVLRTELPPEVEGLVLRLLAKEPESRYASATELSGTLTGAAPITPAGALASGKGLIGEVRRHALWQVLVSYAVGSWVILQIAETLTSLLGLPLWFGKALIVVLAVGLPVLLLTAAAQSARGAKARSSAGRRRHLGGFLTWRRAIVGGFGAFALLGVGTAAYMAMRSLGIGPPATLIAQGSLENRGKLLVAQFENQTRDSLLAPAITGALMIDLMQSPALRVVERRDLADALERMEESRDATIDVPLARELALREGIGAVVAGRVSQVGAGYSLSAQLVTPQGEVLTSARETAADSTQVIAALDRLSKKLRERIGEPLRSLRNSRILQEVTTPSLPALKKYTLARSAGGSDAGIRLHEEALALDSTFAMAWRSLGAEYALLEEDPARRVEAYARAFQHRDRVPARERYLIDADYYGIVTGELEKSVAAYDSLIAMAGDDFDSWYRYAAVNNKGIRYIELRQFARAEELYLDELEWERRVTGRPGAGSVRRNLVVAQANLGKYEEALASLDMGGQSGRLGPFVGRQMGNIAAAMGDYERAEARFRALVDVTREIPSRRAEALATLSALAALRGELREAERLTRDGMAALEARGRRGEALGGALDLAERKLWVRRDTIGALGTIAAELDLYSLEDMQPFSRPYLRLASLYARAGRVERARELLAEFDSVVDPRLRGPPGPRGEYHRARGEIALAAGDPQEAIAEFTDSDVGGCVLCALPGLARAYDRAGDADSAITLYERYIDTPYIRRLYFLDQLFLADAYERLGQLYEAGGDSESAAESFRNLVALWEGADEELQPRVRRVRSRLDELCRNVACADLPTSSVPTTGTLSVSITERGEDLDLNGYVVRIDLGEDSSPLWLGDPLTQKIEGGGSATFTGLTPGSHTAHLIDLWPNCESDGPDTRSFTTRAGEASAVAFAVACEAEDPASVDVSGMWTGPYETVMSGVFGDAFLELEQVGDDVVGMLEIRLDADTEGDAPLSGDLMGRVSGNRLTLFTDYGGESYNPGRLQFFLEVDGDEIEGTWSWDGAMSFGTMNLTRR
jgi:tetratricopeptide (TPR) repeat protein